MAATVFERPNTYCFSRNEIRYAWNISDPDAAGCYLQIQLYYFTVADATPVLLKTFILKPTPEGKVYLYIQQYIDSLLTYNIPGSGLCTAANKQVVFFGVKFREVTDADPTPEYNSSELDDNSRLALKSGIQKEQYGRNNFFINYFDTAKPFFTWRQTNQFVFSAQNNFISIFLKAGSTANHSLKIRACDTEGTVTTDVRVLDEIAGYIFHLRVIDTFLDLQTLIGADKILYWYEVSIVHSDDNAVIAVNPFRYYIDYRNFYTYYDVIFYNSLGGIDAVRLRGDYVLNIERNTDAKDNGVDVGNWNATEKTGEYGFANISRKETFKGDMGYVQTQAEKERLMMELLLSKQIYHYQYSRWQPVLNMQRSFDFKATDDKHFNFPVEWQLPFENEVYTPEDVNLGTGTDTEIYG